MKVFEFLTAYLAKGKKDLKLVVLELEEKVTDVFRLVHLRKLIINSSELRRIYK